MKNHLNALMFLFLIISADLYTMPVDSVLAKKVAHNFYYNQNSNTSNNISYSDIHPVLASVRLEENKVVYYIFNIESKNSYVIVAAEDNVIPILGYSFNIYWTNGVQPPALIEWMTNYKDQIIYVKENKIKASDEIRNIWEFYKNKNSGYKYTKGVDPLLSTTWNQGCFYNDSCPEDPAGPCGKVWTGCVATAQAQIMKYYNYPNTGKGSHCYECPDYGEQCANFGETIYNWSNMPNSITNSNSNISQLMYHVGVSLEMNYGIIGSGAPGNGPLLSLVNFFNYSSILMNIIDKRDFDADGWSSILFNELDSNRPIYYIGGGETNGCHAFVCDGLQNPDYFHFNWGWGGAYDGYFYLNDLSPGNFNFNLHNYAIIGIKPQTTPISVLSPNGNELWDHDSIANIYWEDTITENVKIELYKDDLLYTTITESTLSDGKFEWIIPNEIQDDTNYKLKIVSTLNNEFFDYSNNSFSINRIPHVIRPNGGENWMAFYTKTIKWNDIGKDVKIELDTAHYTPFGYTYEYYSTITDSATNGSYQWHIPWNHEIGWYKIKISDNYNNMAFDYGEELFSISAWYSLFTDLDKISFSSDEGVSESFNITSHAGWQITEYPNWIDVSDTSGVGDRNIILTTNCKNETGSDRYDTLYINCQSPCTLPLVKLALFQELDASGIDKNTLHNRITIYPNPTNYKLIIETTSIDLLLEKIIMTNIIGKEVYRNDRGEIESILEINVSMLNAGVYFTTLQTNKGAITKKVIIQH